MHSYDITQVCQHTKRTAARFCRGRVWRIGQEAIPQFGRYMQPVLGKRRGVMTGLTEQIGITEN